MRRILSGCDTEYTKWPNGREQAFCKGLILPFDIVSGGQGQVLESAVKSRGSDLVSCCRTEGLIPKTLGAVLGGACGVNLIEKCHDCRLACEDTDVNM